MVISCTATTTTLMYTTISFDWLLSPLNLRLHLISAEFALICALLVSRYRILELRILHPNVIFVVNQPSKC